ncbi:transcription elongation factor Elf1 like-domain-containing protein [Diplogelasinospora grovesii]|uniref:Transcription elongation factor 1 homolog n=1 Tax=Diplogelasinospora grovesii TaxID=303347 RepID=A0AAN6S945_9PEZI|nr:transcription elongation factor Elf1 like-domain-containing protein [Diplogelasinospora grovesii]
MGKRKKSSRKPQGPKKNEPLPTVFTCLFCNHEKSVQVRLDKKAGVGQLDCKVCGQKFQCAINYLSAAVDVYSEWVDAADAVAQQAEAMNANKQPPPSSSSGGGGGGAGRLVSRGAAMAATSGGGGGGGGGGGYGGGSRLDEYEDEGIDDEELDDDYE